MALILVADDSENTRLALSALLWEAGHERVEAAD